VTAEGIEDTVTVTFTFSDETQITDMVLHVGVAGTSTAKEGVDFELSAHEIEVPAFGGQDGVSVDVYILQDGEIEAEDETIYLTFSSADPSGFQPAEVLVATIEDSGVSSLSVALSWDSEFEYDGDTWHLADSTDLDFYLYDENGDDVSGFSAATGAEPEEMELVDLPDGTYEIWVNFWNRVKFEDLVCTDALGNSYSCLGSLAVPINITYTRNGVEKVISYPVVTHTTSTAWRQVGGVNTNPYEEYYIGSIEVSAGTFTFFDLEGVNAGSLRKRTKTTSEGRKK
jgi:hypothetical protein